MLNIRKQYIVDENQNKIGVQLDVETFERIEQLLEDYALGKFINETKDEEAYTLNEAKEVYFTEKKDK